MRLYGNLNVSGLSAQTYSSTVSSQTNRVTLNIVESCCDTVTQKIGKNQPKPTFITLGGEYLLKQKAKKLDKFIQGQFYEDSIYEKGPVILKDSTVFGTGMLHHFRSGKSIKSERVFMDEIMVDDAESIYGEPRNLYRHKFVPKELLCKLYPQYKAKIMACKSSENLKPVHSSLSNMILVVEAYHLATDEESKDGRRTMCIENEVLEDDKNYSKTYFPFSKMVWKNGLLGYFGVGLSEQLTGLQVEINKLLRTAQIAFNLCVPKMMIENGSKVVLAHLNNEIGGFWKYSGIKPEWSVFQAVSPDLLQHIERLYSKAYEIAGVSQLAANSQKPAGLDSGKALRDFNDIESERFILVGKAYENFFMDCAKQKIELAKEIAAEGGDYTVKVSTKKFLETINWSDINLKSDEYQMQMFPTSMLSATPAGRLQDVQELIQAGMIDKQNGQRLLDFPDLESYNSLATAPIDDIDSMLENMIDNGLYATPEPYQNLSLGISMCQNAYLKAKTDKVPEENLELLRTWIKEAQNMVQPPQAPQGMPMGSPQAAPMAPPQSDLIPNAPGGAG